MKFLIKLLLSAVAVYVTARILPGVTVTGFTAAIIVAIVLALLNTFVKPVLTILTIPITILTLGLFLLVINVIIIYMADYFIDGFAVSGFITALFFSIILAVANWLLASLLDD